MQDSLEKEARLNNNEFIDLFLDRTSRLNEIIIVGAIWTHINQAKSTENEDYSIKSILTQIAGICAVDQAFRTIFVRELMNVLIDKSIKESIRVELISFLLVADPDLTTLSEIFESEVNNAGMNKRLKNPSVILGYLQKYHDLSETQSMDFDLFISELDLALRVSKENPADKNLFSLLVAFGNKTDVGDDNSVSEPYLNRITADMWSHIEAVVSDLTSMIENNQSVFTKLLSEAEIINIYYLLTILPKNIDQSIKKKFAKLVFSIEFSVNSKTKLEVFKNSLAHAELANIGQLVAIVGKHNFNELRNNLVFPQESALGLINEKINSLLPESKAEGTAEELQQVINQNEIIDLLNFLSFHNNQRTMGDEMKSFLRQVSHLIGALSVKYLQDLAFAGLDQESKLTTGGLSRLLLIKTELVFSKVDIDGKFINFSSLILSKLSMLNINQLAKGSLLNALILQGRNNDITLETLAIRCYEDGSWDKCAGFFTSDIQKKVEYLKFVKEDLPKIKALLGVGDHNYFSEGSIFQQALVTGNLPSIDAKFVSEKFSLISDAYFFDDFTTDDMEKLSGNILTFLSNKEIESEQRTGLLTFFINIFGSSLYNFFVLDKIYNELIPYADSDQKSKQEADPLSILFFETIDKKKDDVSHRDVMLACDLGMKGLLGKNYLALLSRLIYKSADFSQLSMGTNFYHIVNTIIRMSLGGKLDNKHPAKKFADLILAKPDYVVHLTRLKIPISEAELREDK